MAYSAVHQSPTGILGTASPGSLAWQHPEYRKRWWWWELGRVSYLGGREYLEPDSLTVRFNYPTKPINPDGGVPGDDGMDEYKSLLHRHKREDAWEYANRRRRAQYFNFVGPVVNGLVSHATKKPAVRVGTPELERWWDGVDYGRSLNLGQFVAVGARQAQVQGIYWACVDNDPMGDGQPYAYWVSPLDIWDWHVGEDGTVEWLKQFVYGEQSRAAWSDGFATAHKMRIWYRDRVEERRLSNDGTEVAGGTVREHGLGRVPLEPMYSQRKDDSPFPDGTPIAGDLCVIANSVFNLGSNLDEILFDQTFAQLVVPDPGKMLDKIQLSVHRYIGFDSGGGSGSPTYVSPPADNARVLMEAIGMKLMLGRQAIGVGRGRAEGSMQQASAESLELESEDKKAVLSTIAAECEDFEKRLTGLFMAYRKAPVPESVYIQYPREFDMHALSTEIAECMSLAKLPGWPDEANKRQIEDIIRRKWASLPREEIEKLIAGIDMDREEVQTPDHTATSADNEGDPTGGSGAKTATAADDAGEE